MSPFQTYQPHSALKPYVRYYWSLDIQLEQKSLLDLQVTADRFPRIVIQCLQGKNALHSGHYGPIYPASLKGVTLKPALVYMEPSYSHIAVSFFPHGVKALLGVECPEVTDGVVDLQHFIPHEVIERIISTQNHTERVRLLDTCLLNQLSRMKPIDWRVVNFLQRCPKTHYGKVLKDYGISERQFERKFLQSIGMTPTCYKRVLRFESALHAIQHSHYTSLADLAYELGYADQSHFNREFKQFSGLTPMLLNRKDELVNESGSILAG